MENRIKKDKTPAVDGSKLLRGEQKSGNICTFR